MNDNDIRHLRNYIADLEMRENIAHWSATRKRLDIIKKIKDILFPENRYNGFLHYGFGCNYKGDFCKSLLVELKRGKLVQRTTKDVNFSLVLLRPAVTNKIVWCGSLRSLAWFVEKFCGTQPHRWKTASECFVIRKGGKRGQTKPSAERLKKQMQIAFANLMNNEETDKNTLEVESIYNAMFPQQKQV